MSITNKREIFTIDCETDPFKANRIPKPFVWGAYNGSKYWEFEKTDDIINFLAERECLVYAHNGGRFDYHFIFSYLEAFSDVMIINGRVAKFNIGKAEFRDSLQILPMRLADFQKDEVDYAIFEKEERDKPENKKVISDYLKNDCIYLYDLIENFINEYGLNLTVASTALKIWESINGEKVHNSTAHFYEKYKKFYYGGRVECFDKGIFKAQDGKTFDYVDINSAYPFAMKFDHPYSLIWYESNKLPKKKSEVQKSFIEVECDSFGAFPFRSEKEDKLLFPNDGIRRTYYISGWEFLAALETKKIKDIVIKKVWRAADEGKINFSKYIDKFYSEREVHKQKLSELEKLGKEGTKQYNKIKALSNFCKLFLNSLYGKFGSNPSKFTENIVMPPEYITAAQVDGWEFCSIIGNSDNEEELIEKLENANVNLKGKSTKQNFAFCKALALFERPIEEDKQNFYNVLTAASITGFVRAYLLKALATVENPYYCDTDSIICKNYGDLEIDSKKLGAWDIEDRFTEIVICGKKMYCGKYEKPKSFERLGKIKKITHKVASKGANLEPEQLYKMAKGKTVFYESEVPQFSFKKGISFRNKKLSMT